MRFSVVGLLLLAASQTAAFSSPSIPKSNSMVLKSTTTETEATASIGAVGSKLTNVELAKEALSKFFDPEVVDKIELTPTTGGVNNIVQYVTLPSGEKQLLRIYNNPCDEKRVHFAHGILKQLHAMEKHMSFQVPNFIPS